MVKSQTLPKGEGGEEGARRNAVGPSMEPRRSHPKSPKEFYAEEEYKDFFRTLQHTEEQELKDIKLTRRLRSPADRRLRTNVTIRWGTTRGM